MKKLLSLILLIYFIFSLNGCTAISNLNYFVSDYQVAYSNHNYEECDKTLLKWADYVIETNKITNEGKTLKSFQFKNGEYFQQYCQIILDYINCDNQNNETKLFLIDSIAVLLPYEYNYLDILATKDILVKTENTKLYNSLCRQNDKMLLKLEEKVIEKEKEIDFSNHKFFDYENYNSFVEKAKDNEYLVQFFEVLKPCE